MIDLTNLKFKGDGSFNHFRGNTVVANLYDKKEVIEAVNYIQSVYRKLPFIDKFTLTPEGSIHMTVIELLCDQNRELEYWSQLIPLDLPIDEVTQCFGETLSF